MNKPEKLPEDLHERSALGFGRNLVASKPATMSVNYYFDGKYFIDPGTQKKCGALYGAKIESGTIGDHSRALVQYYLVMDETDHQAPYRDLSTAKHKMVGLMEDLLTGSLRDQFNPDQFASRVEVEWVDWGDFNPTDLLHASSTYNDALAKMSRSLKSYTMEAAAGEVLWRSFDDLKKCLVFNMHLEGVEISDKILKKLTQRKLQEWDVEHSLQLANALSIMSSPEKVKENRTHLV
jgi:hypothetical protein